MLLVLISILIYKCDSMFLFNNFFF
jgi:hypothetical protein